MSAIDQDEVQIRRLADCTFREAVELWNVGFSGYYSNMEMTLDRFVARMGRESIRPELSVAAFIGGEPAGFVLVAHETVNGEGVVWNGGTGVNPKFRGKGLAKRIMSEASAAMRESGAKTALLEVVQKNAGAIAAYESAGFRIADGLIGAKRTGTIPADLPGADAANVYRFERVKPKRLSELAFYKQDTPWSGAWYKRGDSEGIVVSDRDGIPGAYALVRKRVEDDESKAVVTLYQCGVDRAHPEAEALLYAALAEAFEVGASDAGWTRIVENVSTADPEVELWLTRAGFETLYTQYLMVSDLK